MILLIESWTNKTGRKYPVGTVIRGTRNLENQLISQVVGIHYDGAYPPQGKQKIELKKLKRNVKNNRK